MTLVVVLLGLALITVVAWDVFLTALHPGGRGPLRDRVNRLVRRVVRRATTAVPRLLAFGGPLAMLANFLLWVVGLWLGYALVYSPFIDDFSYAPAVPFGDVGFAEALYVSGVALATVGFGDVVAGSDALRLVTVAESASGLALITAAVAYLLSVNPLIITTRTSALRVARLDLDRVAGATRIAATAGAGVVDELQRDVTTNHQNLRRFPILYYFHSPQYEESVAALLRGGIVMALVLTWGVRHDRLPFAAVYGAALRRTLDGVITDYEEEFVGGRGGAFGGKPVGEDEARRRLRELRAEVAGIDPALPPGSDVVPPEFAAFLARADAFMNALAREHRYPIEPPPGGTLERAGEE